MIERKIIEKIIESFRELPKTTLHRKGEGWVNLAKFAPVLKDAGLNYKEMGYEKFGDFIADSKLFITWIDFSGVAPVKYIKEKEKKTAVTHVSGNIRQNVPSNNSEEAAKIKRRLRLENNQFIGQFAPQKTEGWYLITDIRNTDFTKIEDKERGIRNITIPFKCLNKEFNKFAYYKFTWVLLDTNPIKFGIDFHEEVSPIYPRDIVNSIYDGIMRYPAGASKKIASSLDTLKKQLTQSGKEVFIYELLQNANDYPRRVKIDGENKALPVEVEFHISKDCLTFQHTGEYFNPKNIAAICDINDGEKADNTEAIGYKGIGFKTVFLDNDYVLLKTGSYSFRFDKSATDVINTPWQILPIWTERNEISNNVYSVFSRHPNDEFRVKFALKPRDRGILTDENRDDNYIDLFSNVFDSERVILFIPNIKKVSIYIEGQDEPIIREKDNKDWCVSDSLVDDIPEDITEKINDVLNNPDSLRSDGYEKIPEKYFNFRKTAVKFACGKEGRKLKKVDDAILYCYLPAKRADWGFDFLMNTDMVPNGQRDDIEDIELNHVIARIAGKQFFYWIKQLIESEEYDLDSIFALIPDFKECKNRRAYKVFIEEFQEEFEKLIKEVPFVPTRNKDGIISYRCIDEIINDISSMTAGDVMSDKDFIELFELEDYALPIGELRQSEFFMDFLYAHSPADLDIDVDKVIDKCEESDFQNWLLDEYNNMRFIKHWLGKNQLVKFSDKTIFLEFEGELFKADDLYYDFDTNCNGIEFLRSFIPHLLPASKNYFEKDKNWKTFADKEFQPFSADSMISNYILSNEDAIGLLNEPNNSVAFCRYLAAMDVDLKDDSAKIPYIKEDGKASTDYENHQYFYSDDAYTLTQVKWLGENIINVLSHNYFEGVGEEEGDKLKVLFSRLGFTEFSKDSFISKVIVEDTDFCANINAVIDDDYVANKSFVDYIFDSDVQLKENSLKDYVLRCVDFKGNDIYLCNDDVRYFNQDSYAHNSTYADNTHHAWLNDDMMYALSNAYFEGLEKEDAKKMETFLRQQFGIKTFTDKSFFTDVVIKHKSAIYAKLVDKDSMLAFLDYLKRDAERLFDGSMSFNDIKDMPLLAYDGTVINSREANVQYLEYDEGARILCEKSWCPEVYVPLAQNYTDDFPQDMRQLFKITRFDINAISDIIVADSTLRQSLNNIEENIDFWRWVKSNQKQILSVDKFKKLPLLDKSNVMTNSTDLYISDIYQQDQIESLVTRYVKSAKFVSSDYVETTNENERGEWLRLFKKLGLKSDNKDILFSDILPNLASFEEDSVVAMMTKHIRDLKDKWSERKNQIINLHVRTRSDEYKTLDQVIIINVDEETVSEPFKYILLADEVHPDILKNNKELLLLISSEYENRNLIAEKQIWIETKVKEYLSEFAADENSVKDIHVRFIRELAKLKEEYNIDGNLLKSIKYLTKGTDNVYRSASELTLGSAYSPACDFEGNGVKELMYLSDSYLSEENKDSIKPFFKSIGLHQNMLREDLKYLSIREFACYFWSKCFSRRLAEYETWIDEGCFDNKVCIPTENSIQKPEDLYAPKIAGYAVRAKAPQWEDKVSCKAIVDSIESRDARELFEKLNFRNELSFEDCLYYRSRVTHQREDETNYRRAVINWIISSPNQDEALVDEYRKTQTAKWRNGKGQMRHISELYAIHPDAMQERNVFRGDEFVMQTSAFPHETDSFVKVCEILKIKCLKSTDFKATPIGKKDETVEMVAILRPRLLILSAIENPDRFQELYERYNEKLSKYHFVVCEKIDLGYETIHNDVERIYNDESNLYYVSSWKHNRTFTKFCSRFKKLIGFEVYDNVCEDILDDSFTVEECIDKYCSSLKYNEKFRSYLQELDLTINVEPEKEEPPTQDDDYYKKITDKSVPQEEDKSDNTTNECEQPIKPEDNGSNETTNVTEEEKGAVNTAINGKNIPETSAPSAPSAPRAEDKGTKREVDTLAHVTQQPALQQPVVTAPPAQQPSEGTNVTDTYVQDKEESIETVDEVSGNTETPGTSGAGYNPDGNGHMGSVEKDPNHQPLGERPYKPRTRRHPKPYTKEELERLSSHGTPLQLESLAPTKEEIDLLAQCNISPEQIADTNYLAQLRLYFNLCDNGKQPEESMQTFVRNAKDVTTHKLRDGKFIHACSAARGVMYVSPSMWNIMLDGKGEICVYLDGQGRNFHYIKSKEEFLNLVEKDDVVIKITGKEKVDVVKTLYTGLLKNVKGTAYTLIRVAARTNMDAVFAHYVGAMAEIEDGNEDNNEY